MKHKNVSISATILSVFSFLYPIVLRFWGSSMLQRGDYAREICYFVVVDVSPFPLQPVCIYYLPLISGLFTLASAGVIALFFIYRIHNVAFTHARNTKRGTRH